MDPMVIGILGLAGIFVLIALHVPIGVALAIAGLISFAVLQSLEAGITLFGTEPARLMANPDIGVIPLFLLMGGFSSAAGLSADIYRLAYALFGHYRGGLAIATIGGCAGFGAVCGSSVATVATMTRVALPEMLKRQYSPKLATGCIAAGGTLGMLIPPSIIMVLYGFLTEQFVIALFIAAIVPGLITVLFYCIAIALYVRIRPEAGPAATRLSWKERWIITRQVWGVLLLAFLVLGGLYGGVFTVSEAAAVGAGTAFLFTVFRRKLTWNTVWEVLLDTAANTGMIYLLLMGASIFTFSMTLSGLPEATVGWITALAWPPLLVIFALMLMYLVLGSVFETVSAMIITLPFVFPLILELGYDPIWWGIINLMVIEIGLITPPIGINVFVIHGMAREVSLSTIFAGIMPFFVADIARLIILVIFPVLVLWLPRFLGIMG